MNIDKLLKEINEGKNIKENAGLLVRELSEVNAKSALVNLAFSYATFFENIDGTNIDPDLDGFIDGINSLIKEVFVNDVKFDVKAAIAKAEKIRGEIIMRVDSLTAYTDIFQTYEYVLNRIKGRYEDFNEDHDIDLIVEKCFGYMFSDSNNVSVNERIKDIISQLPVRMTKQKFYETVAESMTIYKGADKDALKLYDYMLRTAGMIHEIKATEGIYKDLGETAEAFKNTDYEALTKDEYDARFEKLMEIGDLISDTFDRLSLLQEVLNNLLVYLFTINYAKSDAETVTAVKAICETNAAFDGRYINITEYVDEVETIFTELEGYLERTEGDRTKLSAARETLANGNIEDEEINTGLNILMICDMLLSESKFVDYKKFDDDRGEVTNEDITKVREALVADYDKLFSGLGKRVRRAIIAQTIKNMPVFLNSKTEIEQYIRYALESCSDSAELAGCIASLKYIIDGEDLEY